MVMRPTAATAHGLQLDVLNDVAGADQLDAGVAHAERGIGLRPQRWLIAGRDKHEQYIRCSSLARWKNGVKSGT